MDFCRNSHYSILPFLLLATGLLGNDDLNASQIQIKIHFVYGRNYTDRQVYDYTEFDQILQHEQFNGSRPTVIYIHGYLESPILDNARLIVEAFLTRDQHNIIVLDYTDEAYGDYFLKAVPHSIPVGQMVASILLDAFDKGLDINKLHIVGHSLGGQISGVIGRNIISKSNKTAKLKRITGLDPANPPYFPAVFTQHLSYRDAEMVDIIHSDAGVYGQPISTGTVDFWPNGGMIIQPGCPSRFGIPLSNTDLCSHVRSVSLFAESVASTEPTFHAVSGWSWEHFKANETNPKNVVNMGIDCPQSAKGDYYLQTNSEPPYSRGIDGIQFIN